MISHRGISVITPLPLGEGKGEGPSSFWTLCVLFFCVFLWEIERTHLMRWHTNNSLGSFFSHRAHRVHWAFLRTVSSPQKASGIQSSQSVTAKDGCWVIVVRCWWLAIGVSRWLRPSLLGRGRGRGHHLSEPCVFCSSVFFCEKKNAPSMWERTLENRWGVFSLTERTEFTEHFCALFRVHRTPPAYREHRALLLKMGVGW